ncbi:hypothetical protein Hte_005869 [Hypoxylon texense]
MAVRLTDVGSTLGLGLQPRRRQDSEVLQGPQVDRDGVVVPVCNVTSQVASYSPSPSPSPGPSSNLSSNPGAVASVDPPLHLRLESSRTRTRTRTRHRPRPQPYRGLGILRHPTAAQDALFRAVLERKDPYSPPPGNQEALLAGLVASSPQVSPSPSPPPLPLPLAPSSVTLSPSSATLSPSSHTYQQSSPYGYGGAASRRRSRKPTRGTASASSSLADGRTVGAQESRTNALWHVLERYTLVNKFSTFRPSGNRYHCPLCCVPSDAHPDAAREGASRSSTCSVFLSLTEVLHHIRSGHIEYELRIKLRLLSAEAEESEGVRAAYAQLVGQARVDSVLGQMRLGLTPGPLRHLLQA